MNSIRDEHNDCSYKMTSVTFILKNVIKITPASLPLTLLQSSVVQFTHIFWVIFYSMTKCFSNWPFPFNYTCKVIQMESCRTPCISVINHNSLGDRVKCPFPQWMIDNSSSIYVVFWWAFLTPKLNAQNCWTQWSPEMHICGMKTNCKLYNVNKLFHK